jgi:hypothetical protein
MFPLHLELDYLLLALNESVKIVLVILSEMFSLFKARRRKKNV